MGQRRLAFYFVFSISFIFFILNHYVPFFSDDLGWKDSLQGLSIAEGVKCLFDTQLHHWLNQNGRFTCHALLQLFAGNGETAYDIFISIVFLSSVLAVVKLVHQEYTTLFASLVVITFLYLSPDSSVNFFWAAGGCNYLVPTLLTCMFLLIIKRGLEKTYSPWTLIALSCFSLLAGLTHEIFALPISFSLFCFVLKDWYKRGLKSVPVQMWILIIPYWIGTLLVVVSPSTIKRVVENGGLEESVALAGFLSKVVTSFKIFRYGRCFYLLLGIILYMTVSKNRSVITFIKENSFLLLSCFVSLGIVAVLGVGGRAIWSIEVFSLIILLRWLDQQIHTPKAKCIANRVGAVLALIVIIHQICLISPFKESWNTYRAVVAQTNQPGFEGTARMDDWHSDNPLIDSFVAHPYEMMMEDVWMRIPLHCNVCRSDVYDYLLAKGSEMEQGKVRNIGGNYIVPYTEEIQSAVEHGAFKMDLVPVAYDQIGSFLYLTWHQLIQSLWAERYPVSISQLYEEEMTKLNIGGKSFLRFNPPIRPVYRTIETVTFVMD